MQLYKQLKNLLIKIYEFYLKEWKEYIATDYAYGNVKGTTYFNGDCYYEEGGYSYRNPTRFKEENCSESIPKIDDAEIKLYEEFKVLYFKVIEQKKLNDKFITDYKIKTI